MTQSLVELLSGYAAAPFEYFGYGKKPPPRVDAAVRSPAGFGFENPEARGIGSDAAADRRPRAPAEILNQYPFGNAFAGSVATMAALPRLAHTMVKEGIDTADRWLSATHQLPGAKATDDLVLPVEKRGTEDYSINPNRIEQHDVLAPLGLASMGSPVSALGRETLRAGAKVGRPPESYSPSIGDRLIGKYLDATAPMTDHLHPETGKLMMRYETDPGITMGNPGRAMNSGAMYAKEMPQVIDRAPTEAANDANHLRLLSNAEDNRSSLPGMIQGAVENVQGNVERAARPEIVTPAFKAQLQADGFDTSKVWYHGTDKSFDNFDGVTFFSNDPAYASSYSRLYEAGGQAGTSRVIPAYLRIKNPLIVDLLNRVPGTHMPEVTQIAKAKAAGHDAVIYKDAGGQENIAVIDSAKSARSALSQGRGDRSSGAADASESLKRPKGFGGPIPE